MAGKRKGEVKRVEMRSSSGSTRPMSVPEAHVERFQALGWVLADQPKRTARRKADEAPAED